jgi:hypothetical protein
MALRDHLQILPMATNYWDAQIIPDTTSISNCLPSKQCKQNTEIEGDAKANRTAKSRIGDDRIETFLHA